MTAVGGLFFPQREALGFDPREVTPGVRAKISHAAAEARSFERASIVLKHVGNLKISNDTVQRVMGEVGTELAERRDADPKTADALAKRPEEPPKMAIVECDGGRIRAREPGHGRGVTLSGEKGWRETKNACLINALGQTFTEDPQPEPPECFFDPKHVAKIAQTEALSVASPQAAQALASSDEIEDLAQPSADWRPKRKVRTVLASMECSRQFGKQMFREAKRRRFFDAAIKAFLGDGLPWNWSIWREHFRNFTAILDFIHPLSYLYLAAKTVHAGQADDVWSQYVAWMRGCWQGEVGQVIEELRLHQIKLGQPPADAPDSDPRQIVATTINYLNNNRERMNYPEYRKAGLPVTTAWMESLVKEMNYRVKGTEMFWNDPAGAEAILQIRAAALSDDDRLDRHLLQRPGSPFAKQPKPPKLKSQTCKP